jgi:DNA-binding PadR family transcriptional regulator
MAKSPARQRTITNPLALAVLALLFERPMHPYEMASTLRERQKDASIKLNYGSLYTVVDQLQRAAFIVPQETSRDGRRPERTTYAITDTGLARMREWMRDLVRRPAKEYPQFEAAISLLGVLPPGEAVDLLDERAARLEEAIGAMRRLLGEAATQGLPRLFMMENEYELAMFEAELAWVRGFAREIRGGDMPGLDMWRGFHDGSVRVEFSPEGGLRVIRSGGGERREEGP